MRVCGRGAAWHPLPSRGQWSHGETGCVNQGDRASVNQAVLGGDSLKPSLGRWLWGWGCTDVQEKVVMDGKGFRGEGTVSKTRLWETLGHWKSTDQLSALQKDEHTPIGCVSPGEGLGAPLGALL